jgi:hypothetical protein
MVTRSAITKQKRWRRKGLGERFPFSGYSLGLRKPKKEASSRAENRHRSLSRIYKGPGETRDGNGYPKPEYPTGFTRYEGGYGMISLPAGMLIGKKLYPWVKYTRINSTINI